MGDNKEGFDDKLVSSIEGARNRALEEKNKRIRNKLPTSLRSGYSPRQASLAQNPPDLALRCIFQ
jgi:hypothetical protein